MNADGLYRRFPMDGTGFEIPKPEVFHDCELLDNRSFPVITLCGSRKFHNEIKIAGALLTRAGWIVQGCDALGESEEHMLYDNLMSPEESVRYKNLMDDMWRDMIWNSNAIYVVNVGGYIGDSTRGEMKFAREMGKTIFYKESPDERKAAISGGT